jgi:hypothetical protein
MKSINNIKYTFLAVVFAALIMAGSGCHQTNGSPQALVGLHFHTYIDTNLVDPVLYPTQWFQDSLGRLEHLSAAQFYVTNLSFHNKSSQQWYTIAGSVFIKRISNEVYPVGNIPAATYDAISFTVGLGNALNSQSPSAFSTTTGYDTVLSTTEQAVMWGSGMAGMSSMPSGYTFMNVQGYDSADHIPFSYQVGGYGDTVNITLPYPAGFTIAANEPSTLQLVHVIADYGKLLQTVRPINSTNNNSSFYGVTPGTANSIWSNIIKMFRYECPVPNGDC